MNILNLLEVLFYPVGFFQELNEIFILKKALKEKESKMLLDKHNLRVDWIGRIYTVFAFSPEIASDEQKYYPILLEKLKPLNDVLLKIGINDMVYPRIKKVDSINFLVILEPDIYYLDLRNLVLWVFGLAFWGVVFYWMNGFVEESTGVDAIELLKYVFIV